MLHLWSFLALDHGVFGFLGAFTIVGTGHLRSGVFRMNHPSSATHFNIFRHDALWSDHETSLPRISTPGGLRPYHPCDKVHNASGSLGCSWTSGRLDLRWALKAFHWQLTFLTERSNHVRKVADWIYRRSCQRKDQTVTGSHTEVEMPNCSKAYAERLQLTTVKGLDSFWSQSSPKHQNHRIAWIKFASANPATDSREPFLNHAADKLLGLLEESQWLLHFKRQTTSFQTLMLLVLAVVQ